MGATARATPAADSDDVGHVFQQEVGHRFRFEAGRGSDLMSATWPLLPRIEVMMFCLAGLVKRAWIWASANEKKFRFVRVGPGGGGQRRAERAFHCAVA